MDWQEADPEGQAHTEVHFITATPLCDTVVLGPYSRMHKEVAGRGQSSQMSKERCGHRSM
jgi:hypothetical protein